MLFTVFAAGRWVRAVKCGVRNPAGKRRGMGGRESMGRRQCPVSRSGWVRVRGCWACSSAAKLMMVLWMAVAKLKTRNWKAR